MYVCVCMHVGTYEDLRSLLGVFLCPPPPWFLSQGLSLNPEFRIRLDWLASERQESSWLYSIQSWDYRHAPAFPIGIRDLNSGLHVCMQVFYQQSHHHGPSRIHVSVFWKSLLVLFCFSIWRVLYLPISLPLTVNQILVTFRVPFWRYIPAGYLFSRETDFFKQLMWIQILSFW